ncbi:MAG: hypothetical protein V1904_06265 [Bacteroidota bacterium]
MINNKNKLVLVEWQDSYNFSNNWELLSQMQKPECMICVSVGWITQETKENILIVPHISDIRNKNSLGTGYGVMSIPKSAIVKRKFLK